MQTAFAVGIDVTQARAMALRVDVKSGEVVQSDSHATAEEAFAQVASDQIVGIGIAADSSVPFSRPFVATSRARACVPGAGVASPATMVLRFDDSACTLLMNSRIESHESPATMREDGILPGYFGHWFAPVPVDLSSEPSMLAFAFDVRSKCESLEHAGVPVRRFVATGEISRTTPVLMQLLADVIDGRIKIAASEQPEALGAAVLAAIHARTHASMSLTVHAMAHVRRDLMYRPDIHKRRHFDDLFASSNKSSRDLR